MYKLTDIGREERGQLLGFKNYIEIVELEKLKMLAEEDQEYFYEILPYVYALRFIDYYGTLRDVSLHKATWFKSEKDLSFGNINC